MANPNLGAAAFKAASSWLCAVTPSGKPSKLSAAWSALYDFRAATLERIEQVFAGDAYGTGLMQALLIGETGKLEKVWTEHFRRTGTYHALVISGLIAIAVGLAVQLLAADFDRSFIGAMTIVEG